MSRREVLKYGLSVPVLLGLGTVAATVDAPKASAADMRLIDFAERLVPPDQIKSAGFDGVLVYVSESRPGANFDFKPVTREYADAVRAAGLHIVSCYQYGKPGWPTPSDFTAGTTAAWQTLRQLCGCTAQPVVRTRRRSSSVSRGYRPQHLEKRCCPMVSRNQLGTGRGAHRYLWPFPGMWWAVGDGVIGPSTTAGHWWAWQTKAWSHGEREPRAVLYQAVVVTASSRESPWAVHTWMWTRSSPPISGSGILVDDLAGAGLHHGHETHTTFTANSG